MIELENVKVYYPERNVIESNVKMLINPHWIVYISNIEENICRIELSTGARLTVNINYDKLNKLLTTGKTLYS